MEHRIFPAAVIAFILFATVSSLHADEKTAAALKLNTERAVVFKDGYGLIIRQATGVADENGVVRTYDLPDNAMLGSFWTISEEHPVRAMHAERVQRWVVQDQPANRGQPMTLPQILQAVNKQTVTLTLEDGEQVEGRYEQTVQLGHDHHVLISMDEGEPRAVELSQIVGIDSDHLKKAFGGQRVFANAKRLSIDFGEEAAGKKVSFRLMYFTAGIRWIPTYRLDGELKTTGRLSLQAEILNEIDDLEDAAIDLVVGVPNFRFKGVISPLSLESTMRNALVQAAPQLMGQFSNAQFASRAGERVRHGAAPNPAAAPADVNGLAPNLAATGEQDLFVYSIKSFSLKRGGRASVALWQRDVPLRHLYTLDLPLVRNTNSGDLIDSQAAARGQNNSPLQLIQNRVWHQLELQNNADIPWTTGPAMVLRNHLPLGQEMIAYTPIGGATLLPVTVAVDIRGTIKEQETGRKVNAKKWNGYDFTEIRKRGTLRLTNYRKEPATIRVRLAMGGKVTEVSDEGDISHDDFKQNDWQAANSRERGVNQHSDIVWELELKPGETKDLTYECSYFVSR